MCAVRLSCLPNPLETEQSLKLQKQKQQQFHSILHSYTLMTMAETFVNCGYSMIYLHKVFASNKYSKVSNVGLTCHVLATAPDST